MTIKILAFGQAAEITGKAEWVDSNIKNTEELIQKLNLQFPGLAAINCRLAVNRQIVQYNTALIDGDIIALLPPFSGG